MGQWCALPQVVVFDFWLFFYHVEEEIDIGTRLS